ncbi:hypothetical protein XBP1_400004 [Xenorhabdus bovienii str. puntauvense]|uniref:Uncharacterized protein n=1 Tax=Xenorhabdus bovienii str. puntauvense TaxID=1398201 RepID=A0A077NL31_XENBV|nr:hypothetical protein [Xenorhabdus bovienii]CDG98610.1 hypothetical protein XBP1_400004 [Xenorhabdus bovienii str. puntauvense]
MFVSPTIATISQDIRISGYQVESIDPRLHDVQHADPTIQPNFHWQHDLSGNILHTKSVDSGNSFALNDIEGRPIQIINAQGIKYHYQYETAPLTGRLLSVDEQPVSEVTSRTIRPDSRNWIASL